MLLERCPLRSQDDAILVECLDDNCAVRAALPPVQIHATVAAVTYIAPAAASR